MPNDLYDYLPDIYQVIYIVILQHLTYCAPLLMPPKKASTSTQPAHWTDEETAALIDYLHQHRTEHTGGGGFKTPTFTALSDHLGKLNLLKKGGPKTADVCKRKWKAVRLFLID